MSRLTRLCRDLEIIAKIFSVIAGFLLILMMLIMCYEVVMRYFFHRSPSWAIEICEYIIFFIAFLTAPWLLKVNGHVNIDLVISRMNSLGRKILNVLSSFVGAITCSILALYGAITAWDHFRRGIPEIRTLSIPKFIFLLTIATSCCLLSILFYRQFFSRLKNSKALKKEAENHF